MGLISFFRERVIDPVVDFVEDKVIDPVVDKVIDPVVDFIEDEIVDPVVDFIEDEIVDPAVDFVEDTLVKPFKKSSSENYHKGSEEAVINGDLTQHEKDRLDTYIDTNKDGTISDDEATDDNIKAGLKSLGYSSEDSNKLFNLFQEYAKNIFNEESQKISENRNATLMTSEQEKQQELELELENQQNNTQQELEQEQEQEQEQKKDQEK